jgi:hypothetical protein
MFNIFQVVDNLKPIPAAYFSLAHKVGGGSHHPMENLITKLTVAARILFSEMTVINIH